MEWKTTQIFLDTFKISLCLLGTVSAFFTVIDLTYFLSIPNDVKVTTLTRGKN